MSLIIKLGKYQSLPPAGLHIARCFAVIDCGKSNDQPSHYLPQILFGWELTDIFQDDGNPFIQLQRYGASLSVNSKLRVMLESWRGKPFTTDELNAGFSLENMLGTTCYLSTRPMFNHQSQQRWSEVSYITPLPPTITCPPLIHKPLLLEMDDVSEEVYQDLPEIIRKKIQFNI